MKLQNGYFRIVKNVTGATTLDRRDSGSLITNVGATGSVAVTLPADAEVGDHFVFAVSVAQNIVITSTAGVAIIAGGTTGSNGGTLSADDEGEAVSIVKVSATKWLAYGAVGTWTAA